MRVEVHKVVPVGGGGAQGCAIAEGAVRINDGEEERIELES